MFLVVDLDSPEEMEEEIPVVICAAAGRMGAAVAAISSIYSNTEANVLFYIVGLKTTIPHIRYVPALFCFMLCSLTCM